jgi:Flp pilus assembly protein TadB
VTIGRWLAHGVQTLLLFDPTRGIDVRTKRQIYPLVRELAEQGAAILYYTSELEEVPLACDRARGDLQRARRRSHRGDRGHRGTNLMRAAYGLTEKASAEGAAPHELRAQKHAWTSACSPCCWCCLALTRLIQPSFGASGLESLARAALPFAFATAAMAVVVIVGGIDLSVASMMAVCAVTAAVLMQIHGRRARRFPSRF